MTECTNENIHLFIKYMRGELHRKEERQIDNHVQQCQDCFFNFAYVEEIFRNRQKLTTDEKTLLFKYISDPIWQHEQNKLKQQIKQEVLAELNLLNNTAISASATKNDTANSTSKSDKTNNDINSSNDKKQSKESNDRNTALISQNSYIAHRGYSIFIAVAFTIIFLSLSTSIYLIIKNQNLSLFTSSAITTPNVTIANNTSNTSIISVDNNLYQQLDSVIDKYLESKGSSDLQQAEDIANEIKQKYGDKYGVDLVVYYQSVPLSEIDKLPAFRKEMFELINQTPGDHYEEALKQSQKLERTLFQVGNKIEAYRVKTITNKLHTMLYNYKLSELTTQEGLKFSTDNQYLFLRGYFLLWQAKQLSETSSFEQSEKIFQQTVAIGQQIHLDDLITTARVSLSTLYHLNSDDLKCLETAQNLLSKPEKMKKTRIIALLQIAGLAATSLKYDTLSNQYLKDSLRLAEEIKNPAYVARSYMFLSLSLAEKKNFLDSNNYYLRTIENIAKITDEKTRLEALYISLGYYGKVKLLEGDFAQASNTYKQALTIMKDLNIQNNLQLSQINEGLAIASRELKNDKETQQYLATANYYGKLAETNKQKTNCLLSFIPNSCYLK